MRRVFAWLLALMLLIIPAAQAEEEASMPLTQMSVEKLNALYEDVVTRIAVMQSGDVVYDEDGVTIVWNRLLDTEWDYFKFGFTILNQTGQDYLFQFSSGGINGIQMGPGSNSTEFTLENGFALYTGSYNRWLFDNLLAELNISHVYMLYIQVSLYDLDTSPWLSDPVRVINVQFPVDIPIE